MAAPVMRRPREYRDSLKIRNTRTCVGLIFDGSRRNERINKRKKKETTTNKGREGGKLHRCPIILNEVSYQANGSHDPKVGQCSFRILRIGGASNHLRSSVKRGAEVKGKHALPLSLLPPPPLISPPSNAANSCGPVQCSKEGSPGDRGCSER